MQNEQLLKQQIALQNEKLKECLRTTNDSVQIGNENNLELHRQGGIF